MHRLRTWTGQIAPLHDGVGVVSPIDLVVQTGRAQRFGAAGREGWTVLHHTALATLAWIAAGYPMVELVWIVLHDQHEAYTTDVPAPIKRMIRELAEAWTASKLGMGGERNFSAAIDPLGDAERYIDQRIREALLPQDQLYRDGWVQGPDKAAKARVKAVDVACLVIEAAIFGPPGCYADVRINLSEDLPEAAQAEVLRIAFTAVPDLESIRGRQQAGVGAP